MRHSVKAKRSRGFPGVPWHRTSLPCRCAFGPGVRKSPWRRRGDPPQFLAWETPRTEEPGGSQRAAAEHTCVHKAHLKAALRTGLKTVFTTRNNLRSEECLLLKNNVIKTRATDIQTQPSNCSNDEMVGQHHPLSGHESERTPGDTEGQGSLAGCRPRGRRATHD